MIFLLQVLAEKSVEQLKSIADINVKQVTCGNADGRSDSAKAQVVMSGVRQENCDTATLYISYGEGVCRQIASHILGQSINSVEESAFMETLFEVTAILIGVTQTTMRSHGLTCFTTPLLGCIGGSWYHHVGGNNICRSVVLDTNRGPVTCSLVTVKRRTTAAIALDGNTERKPKLLIVDDSSFIRSIIEDVARRMGFETEFAYNGESALVKFAQFRPDLVTLEHIMPGMDGVACLRKIKYSDPSTEVMIVSSLAHRDRVKECLQYGASGYLLKPFREHDLEKYLCKMLAHRADRVRTPPDHGKSDCKSSAVCNRIS